MARGSQEREQEFIASATEKTGHSVAEWMDIIKATGLEAKTNTILKHLKSEHGLNHMQANYLAGIFLNDGEPVFNYASLFANLFAGNEHWQPLYESLKTQVAARFDDVVFIPTKAYISIEGEKIFACVKFTKKAVRYGLDLGAMPFTGRVQQAKGLGAMPNLTHMIELTATHDVDAEVLRYTQQAFDRVHQ